MEDEHKLERKVESKVGLRNEAKAGDLGSPAEGLNTGAMDARKY